MPPGLRRKVRVMKKLILMLLVLTLTLCFASCIPLELLEEDTTITEAETTEPTKETTGSTMDTPPTVNDGKYSVGEVVESRGIKITYVSCEEYTPGEYDFFAPQDGYRIVICTFEFENTGTSDLWLSYYDFDCYADSYNCENRSFYFDNPLSATLSSGRKAAGVVAFEVPNEAKVIELEYDIYDFFDTKRIVFVVE